MNENKVIIPTIGRQVWFYGDLLNAMALSGQPMAATIIHVWSDRCVNLDVIDHRGAHHFVSSCSLLQEGEGQTGAYYCEWMPYQKAQASKPPSTFPAVGSIVRLKGGGGPHMTVTGDEALAWFDPDGRRIMRDHLPAEALELVETAKDTAPAQTGGIPTNKLSLLSFPIGTVFVAEQAEAALLPGAEVNTKEVLTRSRVCGVDCKPGTKECNNYCDHDRTQPMARSPLTYTIDLMTFSYALTHLKDGKKIARAGWNGKGMFVYLNKGSVDGGATHPLTIDGVSRDLFGYGDKGTVTRLPNINMRTASGATLTGWLASQTDTLAEDWVVVE